MLAQLRQEIEKSIWPPDLKWALQPVIRKCAYLRRFATTNSQTLSLLEFESLSRSLVESWDPTLIGEVFSVDLAPWHGDESFRVHPVSGGSVMEVKDASRKKLADLNELQLEGNARPHAEQFDVEPSISVLSWTEDIRQDGIIVARSTVLESGIKKSEVRIQALVGQGSFIIIVGIGGVLLTDCQWLFSHWREICASGEQSVSIFPPDSGWLMTLWEDGQVTIGVRKTPWRHQILLPTSGKCNGVNEGGQTSTV